MLILLNCYLTATVIFCNHKLQETASRSAWPSPTAPRSSEVSSPAIISNEPNAARSFRLSPKTTYEASQAKTGSRERIRAVLVAPTYCCAQDWMVNAAVVQNR